VQETRANFSLTHSIVLMIVFAVSFFAFSKQLDEGKIETSAKRRTPHQLFGGIVGKGKVENNRTNQEGSR